jgi:hypothetical protein
MVRFKLCENLMVWCVVPVLSETGIVNCLPLTRK